MSSKKLTIGFVLLLAFNALHAGGQAQPNSELGQVRQEMDQLKQEYEQQRLAYEQRLGKLEEQLKRMETSSPAPAAVSVRDGLGSKIIIGTRYSGPLEFRRSTIVPPRRQASQNQHPFAKRRTPFNWLLPSRKTTVSVSGRNVCCANTSISGDISEQATDVIMRVALKLDFRHQEPWRKDAWATKLKIMESSS